MNESYNLLRRFEKAFLLAVDIGSHDLFMDIHYLALDKGNTGLAEVAKNKADELDDRPTDDEDDVFSDDDDDDDDSESSTGESFSGEEDDEEDEEEEEDEMEDNVVDSGNVGKTINGERNVREILPGSCCMTIRTITMVFYSFL